MSARKKKGETATDERGNADAAAKTPRAKRGKKVRPATVTRVSPFHADECGDVGETGEHGDLGSNAR